MRYAITLFIALLVFSSLASAAQVIKTPDSIEADHEGKYSVLIELHEDEPAHTGRPRLRAQAQENFMKKQEKAFQLSSKNARTLESAPAVILELTEDEIAELAKDPQVKTITYNRKFHTTLDQSVPYVGGDKVRATKINGVNLTGKGETVCVIDSGIDTDHPSFNNRILHQQCWCNIGGGCCPNSQTTDSSAEDDATTSHGTHVSGIIAGNHTYPGIAPEANIIALKVCRVNGDCDGNGMISAIDWCTSNAEAYNISVISMSISDTGQYTDQADCPTSFDPYINAAFLKNITVAIASGNQGHTNGIGYPSCSRNATSVGWSDLSDSIATNSNRGPLLDIFAPGQSITSSVRGGGYGDLSGTSMATPHIAGTVLLIHQYHRLTGQAYMDSKEIETLLQDNGESISTWKRLNLSTTIDSLPDWQVDEANNKVTQTNVSTIHFNTSTSFSRAADCVTIANNKVQVNSTLCTELNKSATITFHNVTRDKAPVIYQDGKACPPSDCPIINYSGGILNFNVPHFTAYTSGNNANLSVHDSAEGTSAEYNTSITFYANYTNVTNGNAITTGCEIRFNLTGWTSYTNMTYNITSKLHEYNRSLEALGPQLWQVRCNNTLFDELTVTDTVNLTTNLSLIVTDDADNASRYVYQDIRFYANFTNPVQAQSLSDANCTFTLNESATISTANMTYNSSSKLHEYNTSITTPGNHTWSVNCTDSLGNAYASANVSVQADTGAPAVALVWPAQNATLNTSNTIGFQFSGNDTYSPLSTCSVLVNGTQKGNTSSVTYNTNTTVNVTLYDGNYTWHVNCTDASGNTGTSQTRNLTLAVNNIPPQILNADTQINWSEDTNTSINLTTYFNDTDTLTYTVSSATNLSTALAGTILNLTPNSQWHGSTGLSVTAKDGLSNATVNLTLNVKSVNDPPRVTGNIPNQSWSKGNDLNDAFDLDDYFTDIDTDSLTYSVVEDSIDISIDSSNSVSFSPPGSFTGTDIVTFKASDGTSTVSAAPVRLKVNEAGSGSSGSGGGGGGGGGATTCTNECQQGNNTCATNETLKKCGDYDTDNCYEYKIQDCDYACYQGKCITCPESWDCTEWSECSYGGVQTRECTDSNQCGTERTKPDQIRECDAPGLPTGAQAIESASQFTTQSGEEPVEETSANQTGEGFQNALTCPDKSCDGLEFCWQDCKSKYLGLLGLILLLAGFLKLSHKKHIEKNLDELYEK